VLAANLLGPTPEQVPPKGLQVTQTYRSLRGDLDALSNAVREIEADLPFDLAPAPSPAGGTAPRSTVSTAGTALYFCVPRNGTLLAYWDTVADRLFKIRNSLTIEGVFRQLPLFEPPIDPALLARAAAAGLDVAAVVSGLNQPLPLVRFRSLVAKAGQLCQEVRNLGAQLLSALEKKDAETLGVLRARQDRQMLELGEVVKYEAWQEAIKSREALEASLDNAYRRYRHYQRLLGADGSTLTKPELDDLDLDAMDKARFSSTELSIATADASIIRAESAPDDTAGHQLTPEEADEFTSLQHAENWQLAASVAEGMAGLSSIIPNFEVDTEPVGVGASYSFGGSNIAGFFSATAAGLRAVAGQVSFQAGQSARIATYDRREQDWTLQSNAAAGEVNATLKQLRAAQIREAMAQRDYTNHQQQVRNAADIERFLTDARTGKTTNEAFYLWLKRETRGLYGRCFQLAYDTARKAERALQHELGDPSRTFLRYDYRSGMEELLAGERLYLDVTRMELAYDDLSRREYEMTKHVSLRQLDPRKLIELRTTGQCTIDIDEAAFDLDAPGHYFRRRPRGRTDDPLCGRPVHLGELHAHPAVQLGAHQPVAREPVPWQRVRQGFRRRQPVQRLFRRRPVGRHQRGEQRQRPVRGWRRRRQVPAVRGLRRGQPVAAGTAHRDTAVRLRHHLRRRAAPALHRPRRRPGPALDGGDSLADQDRCGQRRRVGPAAGRTARVPHRVGAVHHLGAVRPAADRTADADATRGALPVLGPPGDRPGAALCGAFRLGRTRRRRRVRRAGRQPAGNAARDGAAEGHERRRPAQRTAGRPAAASDRRADAVPRRASPHRPLGRPGLGHLRSSSRVSCRASGRGPGGWR
jgi:hypothetical protein